MAITVSSFSSDASALSQEQVQLFKDADVIYCETKTVMESVMHTLGISLEGKKIFSVFETMESEPSTEPESIKLRYALENFDKKSIVILSDDGFPHIVDPYSGLISQLSERGVHISITPNISSLVSATILGNLQGDNFCFGGIQVPWQDYSSNLNKLKDVSLIMPVILLMVIKDAEGGPAMMDKIAEIFGSEREVRIMHSMGKPQARTYLTQAKNLWNRHEPHLTEPFTLVIYPPTT